MQGNTGDGVSSAAVASPAAKATTSSEDESGFAEGTAAFDQWVRTNAANLLKEKLCSRGGSECALANLVDGALNDTLSGSEIVAQVGTLAGGVIGGYFGGWIGASIGELLGNTIGGAIGDSPVGELVGDIASTGKKVADAIVNAPISAIASLF